MSSPFDLLIPKTPVRRESWFWAAVTTADPLRITRDGDTAAMPYIPEALVPVSSLSVGQRVRCQLYNRTLFIIGAAGGVGQGEEASQTNNWDTTIESGIYYSVAYNSGGPVPSFKYTGVVVNASLGFVTQVLTTVDTDNPEVFSRASSSYGNTWGDWQQIAGLPETHFVGASGEPGFTNGWGNYGGGYSPCIFALGAGNRVTLGGTVGGGTISHTDIDGAIFRLPVDLRPAANHVYAAPFSGVAHGQVNVYSSGYVSAWEVASGGSNAYVGLDGITFLAAS